jgi:hypothetical protein
MNRYHGFPVPALLILLLSVGCASSGATTGGADSATADPNVPAEGSYVQIYNTASGAVDCMIWMVPEGEVEVLLGSVRVGERATFPFNGPPGRYRLRALGTSDFETQTFQFYRNSRVSWDMNSRRALVSGRQ